MSAHTVQVDEWRGTEYSFEDHRRRSPPDSYASPACIKVSKSILECSLATSHPVGDKAGCVGVDL